MAETHFSAPNRRPLPKKPGKTRVLGFFTPPTSEPKKLGPAGTNAPVAASTAVCASGVFTLRHGHRLSSRRPASPAGDPHVGGSFFLPSFTREKTPPGEGVLPSGTLPRPGGARRRRGTDRRSVLRVAVWRAKLSKIAQYLQLPCIAPPGVASRREIRPNSGSFRVRSKEKVAKTRGVGCRIWRSRVRISLGDCPGCPNSCLAPFSFPGLHVAEQSGSAAAGAAEATRNRGQTLNIHF